MKVTNEEIRHIAVLAMLDFPQEKFDKLAKDFENIVGMVAELEKVDLSGITPELSEKVNAFRPDEYGISLSREDVLSNAPTTQMGCILVPKIVE